MSAECPEPGVDGRGMLSSHRSLEDEQACDQTFLSSPFRPDRFFMWMDVCIPACSSEDEESFTVPQQQASTRVTRRSTRTGTVEKTPTHTLSVDNSTVKRGESSTSSDGESRDANDSPVVRLTIRSSGVEASGEREEEMEEDGDVEDNEGEEEGDDEAEEMNESGDEGREEKEEVSMEEMSTSADPSLNGPPVPKKARISTVPQQQAIPRVTRRSTRTGTVEKTPTHTLSVDNSTVKRGESSISSDGDNRDANDSPVIRLTIRSSGVEASGEREEEMEEDGDVEDNEGEEEGDDEAEDDEDGGRPGEHHDLLEDANGRIKVGQEYQARIVTSARETVERDDVTEDRDQVLWCSPTYKIDEQKFNDYIEEAIGTWKMTHDRALFILYKNNHNFEAAIDAVRKRRIVMDEWSEEDRMVFRHSFLHYGKNFRRIRHALPHRPMTSIISFYYTTKKEQGYKDLYEMKHVQHSDSDNDDDEGETGACENCGDKESKLRHVSAGRLCRPCRVYYNITRRHRPTPFRNQLHTPPDPCDVTVKKEWAKCPADMVEVAAEFEQMVRELEKDVPEEERQKNSPNASEVDLSVPLPASSSIVNEKKNTETPSTMALSRNEDVKQEIFRIRSPCLRLHSTLKKQKEKVCQSVPKTENPRNEDEISDSPTTVEEFSDDSPLFMGRRTKRNRKQVDSESSDSIEEESCADDTDIITGGIVCGVKSPEIVLAARKLILGDQNSKRPQRNRILPVRRWLGERPIYVRSPNGGLSLQGVNEVVIQEPEYKKYRDGNPIVRNDKRNAERRARYKRKIAAEKYTQDELDIREKEWNDC